MIQLRLAAMGLIGVMACSSWAGAAPTSKLGDRCGGVAGPRCDEGLWCQMPMGKCYVSDLPGTCARITEICPEIYQPV